jgi:hypothetical protein
LKTLFLCWFLSYGLGALSSLANWLSTPKGNWNKTAVYFSTCIYHISSDDHFGFSLLSR